MGRCPGGAAPVDGGNETVKDLDVKSQVTSTAFSYFPLWLLRLGAGAARRLTSSRQRRLRHRVEASTAGWRHGAL
jgi:hypothetical protein